MRGLSVTFQSRLGTTLHSDGVIGIGAGWANYKVSIPTGHHTSFRQGKREWCAAYSTWFQSRLGTTLLSDLQRTVKCVRRSDVSIPTGHHTSFRHYLVDRFSVLCHIVSIPTGHHTSFRLGNLTPSIPFPSRFNPDWAPHFIPTPMWIIIVQIVALFQSRLGTTLHSDTPQSLSVALEKSRFNPDWAPHFIPTSFCSYGLRPSCFVSIPTGHHTSFRHSLMARRTLVKSCFNPDWAPHFIPTSI